MHQIFDEQTFYKAFADDLRRARALVLIQSPFISDSRLNKIESLLADCIKRNVRVCAFVQRSPDEERAQAVERIAKRLIAVGIHVSFRSFIHEKLAVIDEDILWDGSLNILSQAISTERMSRWSDRNMVCDAIAKHKLSNCDECHRRSNYSKAEHSKLLLIGKIIASRRKTLKVTQRSLGKELGLTQASVSYIESGKRSVRIKTLIQICDRLELELRPVPRYFVPTLDEACNKYL